MMSNSPRYVSELPCDELENIILKFLERYQKYTGILNLQVNTDKLLEHIINCQVHIESKKGNYENIQKGLDGVFTHIRLFYNEELRLKSNDFLQAVDNRMNESTDVYTSILKKQKKIQNVIKSSSVIRNKPIKDRGDVECALQLHVRETEDMQYALLQTVSHKNNPAVDIETMLSIQKKVKQENGFVTDSTAIRNCVSHSLYEITDTSVIFDNHEMGSNYHQEFTFKELQDFLGLKGQLYALLFDLMDLFLLKNIVQIFFRKCRKSSMKL